MRRSRLVAIVVTLIVVGAPGMALAHEGLRDPFDPLIEPEAATGAVGTTTEGATTDGRTGEGGRGDTTEVEDAVGSDRLANTGADPRTWLALAYALLAIGGAALVLARTLRPRGALPRP